MKELFNPRKPDNAADTQRLDLNIGNKGGFDKFTFDSLFADLKAEHVGRGPGEEDNYTTRDIQRGPKYSERNPSIENNYDNQRSDDLNKAPRHLERNSASDHYSSGSGVDKAEQRYRDTVGNENVDDFDTDTGPLNLTTATGELGDTNEEALVDENAAKVGSLLFEMAKNGEGRLINNSLTADVEGDGNSLKTGDVLFELLNGSTKETAAAVVDSSGTSGMTEKEAHGETGLKTGDIISAIINGKVAESGKGQENTDADTEKTKSARVEFMKSESGVKIGELPDKNSGPKEAVVEKDPMRVQKISVNQEAGDTDSEIEELMSRSDRNYGGDKKAEIRQVHDKEVKLQEHVKEMNLQENNNTGKASMNRMMQGAAENLYREAGLKNNAQEGRVVERSNAEAGSIGESLGKSEGGKINPASPAGTILKPSGFAEVVNKIVYVSKGDKTLGVTVEHKDLGKLNIKLSLEKGIVNIHINTADKVAREFVESNIQQIVDSLSKNGVSVGGFSVGLKNYQNKGNGYGAANKEAKPFSIEGMQEQYVQAALRPQVGGNQISVFA